MASGTIKSHKPKIIKVTLGSVSINSGNAAGTTGTITFPSGYSEVIGLAGYFAGNSVLAVSSITITNNLVTMGLINYYPSTAQGTPTVDLLIV